MSHHFSCIGLCLFFARSLVGPGLKASLTFCRMWNAEVAFTFNRHGPFCKAPGEEQKEVAEQDIKVRLVVTLRPLVMCWRQAAAVCATALQLRSKLYDEPSHASVSISISWLPAGPYTTASRGEGRRARGSI